ncbi:MAG TPA: S1/P1 Nuclease [Cytophagales bacterium]|jgi:hypothetical protein|nr:S1/P1 Nuclease [Cytophagales bacterium]
MFNKLLVILIFNTSVYGNDIWGKNGHRAIGEIATQNLTQQTLKVVNKILDGQSLALVSTWADEMKSNSEFGKYSSWHYVNIPLDKEYKQIEKNPKGDIIQAINKCIEVLEDKNSPKIAKSFHLKYLVHLVGDAHQPLHTGRYEDKGGNDIKLKFFGRPTNLHKVWDSDMIDDYKMSYTELAESLTMLQQTSKSLNPEDWVFESHQEVKKIYSEVKDGDYISYDYINKNFSLIELKLYKAGIRLATILNEIL